MILKITINNDNDYTSYIEDFLNNYNCDLWEIVMSILNIYVKDTCTYITTYRELDDFLSSLKYRHTYTKKEKDQLANYIKRAFIRYLADDINTTAYVRDGLKISYVKSVRDRWQNGEVVYFFTSYRKYITM